MSKITFRADDDLVGRLEAHDASKSEVLRAALRAYLDEPEREPDPQATDDTTELTEAELAELLDGVVERRLRALLETDTEQRSASRPSRERRPETGRGDESTAAHCGRPAEGRREPPTDNRRGVDGRRDSSIIVEITPRTTGAGAGRSVVEHTTPPADRGARQSSDTRRRRPPAGTDPVSDTGERQPSDTSSERASDTRRRDTSDTGHGTTHDASARESTPDEPQTDDGVSDADDDRPCTRCGTTLSDDHVYCPNCGEKAAHRLFCDCGDEVRSDWSFCPGCGRRTPAADVLTEDGAGQ